MSETLAAPPAPPVVAGPRIWSMPDLAGEIYTTVLKRFHTVFKPQTYLEIGVLNGATLQLAECPSIGIDPQFRIDRPFLKDKEACLLYQMSSDRFFGRHDPSAILGQPVDMAFLDGMHWFEFLLRDFIHVERHCRRNSIVFMHDCMPTDEHIARRECNDVTLAEASAHPTWWAGDVWKMLAILKEFRPDLRLQPFNAAPTGLVAVTNLDPCSTVLSERYFAIVERYRSAPLAEHGRRFAETFTVRDTRKLASHEALSSIFWL